MIPLVWIDLELCDATNGKEAKYARDVAADIRSVIKEEIKEFLKVAEPEDDMTLVVVKFL